MHNKQRLRRYYNGDHWQDGHGWSGAHFGANAPDEYGAQNKAAEFKSTICNAFTAHNLIKEVVDRHINALSSYNWSLSSGTEKATEQLTELLNEFWDNNNMQQVLKDALVETLLNGESFLRLYVPKKLNNRPKQNLQSVLSLIRCHHALDVCVEADDDGFIESFTYNSEMQRMLDDGTVELTVNKTTQILDFGEYLITRLQCKPLITASVMNLQQTINKVLTGVSVNCDAAGFTERAVLNAQPAGQFVTKNGVKTFEPLPQKVGAGTTTYYEGKVFKDGNGEIVTVIPASIQWRDPSSNANLIEPYEALKRCLLAECGQLHTVGMDSANLSEKSRELMLNDFKASLQATQNLLQRTVRWFLLTALKFANYLSVEKTDLSSVTAQATASINIGSRSTDNVKLDMDMVTAGLLSNQTALALSGRVADIDHELALITAERGNDESNNIITRITALTPAVQAGLLSYRDALHLANPALTEEQLQTMVANSLDQLGGQ